MDDGRGDRRPGSGGMPFGQGPGGGGRHAADPGRQGPGQLDEPGAHLFRAALQPPGTDQRRQCEGTGPGLELRAVDQSRRRDHPDRGRRCDVCDQLLEPSLRPERQDRRTAVEIRSAGAARGRSQRLLRRGQPRRRGLAGQGLCGDPRRAPGGAGRQDRQAGLERGHGGPVQTLHDHHGSPDHQGEGDGRQLRLRIRGAGLCVGL